jgi:hypothetical protein
LLNHMRLFAALAFVNLNMVAQNSSDDQTSQVQVQAEQPEGDQTQELVVDTQQYYYDEAATQQYYVEENIVEPPKKQRKKKM